MQTILDEQLLAAIGPAGKAQNRLIACIGGDPLVDAQDVRLTDFRIDIPEIQGNTVTASVHFRNFGAPGVTKIKLHKIADGWVVTDIGNLRAELEQCAKP
ncbi:MAG: hypothetical protein H6943_10105 [Zoogloeaceae bacterium]|nr:hypothetical protein [Zoogloeaceae bacterium]